MNKTDLAYIAGIVDGEGCIYISKQKRKTRYINYCLYVTVVNTNIKIMERLHLQFGGSSRKSSHRLGFRKPLYRWMLACKSAGEFLKLILPYLLLKKPQAELALEFQARKRHGSRGGRAPEQWLAEEADYIQMKSYNKRGIR